MQIVPRHELTRTLRLAGLEAGAREFIGSHEVHRLTIKEAVPPLFTEGPHRKVTYPDGRIEGPFPIANRPALANFIAASFAALDIAAVLAVIPEGTFWLNNKAQAAHLQKVTDAQNLAKFLRERGLTNRFQGGFILPRAQFEAVIPRLAAHPYVGGADVLFAALSPHLRFTALACHHFDIHFASTDPAILSVLAARATEYELCAETLALPELPDFPEMWS